MPMTEAQRRARADAKRRQILDAALSVFASKGYHATGIADIAAELEMGHGTFYRYFESKLDIFAAIVDDAADEILEAVHAEPVGAPDLASYEAQVERLGMRLFVVFAADPRRAQVILHEALGADPAMRARLEALLETFAAQTAGYLDHGIACGYLRPDLDVEATARLLVMLIVESMRACIGSEDPVGVGLRTTRAGLALMFRGIAAAPAAAG